MMKALRIIQRWTAQATAALALAVIAGCAQEAPVKSPELGWPTDLPKAQEQAKAQHKMVLVDFSGSDWCPDCAMLAKKVFASPEFKTYADANLALVDADFPEKKQLPADLAAANNAMRKKFDVAGFPTVIVLDGDGKVLDKMLNPEDDPAKFIAHLETLKTPAK